MLDIAGHIARIKAMREGILLKERMALCNQKTFADVKRVVIINSASRSGSSLLYAMLRKLPQVYALTGEAAPFYKLNTNLSDFDPHISDIIPTERLDDLIDYSALSRDFLSDLSLENCETDIKRIDADSYCDDLMLRLLLQWPTLEFNCDNLSNCLRDVFDQYSLKCRRFDTEEFYLELLASLNSRWPEINPFYYDIGTDRVALRFPNHDIPSGPPNTFFTLEEPPFILVAPRSKPAVEDLSSKTLLLKSTVDCYRMNLIERIFPNADIRIIHLVRNPAATINGIYDGWLHRGFFSHNLETSFAGNELRELHIKGYSDRFPFGNYWWNFDLPAGWQDVADCDLVEVCAFQWHAANREILKHLEQTHRSVCRIHFEDIIRSVASRKEQFERMLDFMNIPLEWSVMPGIDDMPVVQATLPPQLYRWKRRGDMISRVLNAANIREMADHFGYHSENMEAWL